MTAVDDAAPARPRALWNPFQALDTAQDAGSAARNGAVVSAYIAISYLLQMAMLQLVGKDGFGHSGHGAMLGDAFAVGLATLLTWRILARQALWATVCTAAWFAVELWFKAESLLRGETRVHLGFVVMWVALVAAAIFGVRGAWRLTMLRQEAEPMADDAWSDPVPHEAAATAQIHTHPGFGDANAVKH